MPLENQISQLTQGGTQQPLLATAEVSSVQEDGSLNLLYMGTVEDGVLALEAGVPYEMGDSVAVLVVTGTMLVIGKYSTQGGIVPPSGYTTIEPYHLVGYQDDYHTYPFVLQGIDEEHPGKSSSGAWFYGDQVRVLTGGVATSADIQVYLVRSKDDAGSDLVATQIFLHSADEPTIVSPLQGRTTMGPSLERGQGVWWSLPEEWAILMRRGTHTGLGAYSGSTAEFMIFDDNSGTLALKS